MFYPTPAYIAPSGQAGSGETMTPVERELSAEEAATRAELQRLENRAERIEMVFAIIAAFGTAFGVGEALGKGLGIRRRRLEAKKLAERSGSKQSSPRDV